MWIDFNWLLLMLVLWRNHILLEFYCNLLGIKSIDGYSIVNILQRRWPAFDEVGS